MRRIRFREEEFARLRVLAGLRTQSAVAEAAGISRQALSQVVRRHDAGGVRLRTIGRLCDILSGPDGKIELHDLVELVD
jgi:DNA-binding Xre family transcriptional regulator